TPTHSYCRALYKYPQGGFPYQRLIEENRARGRDGGEFEIADAGVFDEGRYFDVTVEYAKGAPNDVLIRLTISNRASEAAAIHVLPTIWFRNTWAWGRTGEGYWKKPKISVDGGSGRVVAEHESLGVFRFAAQATDETGAREWLFTENETNAARLFGAANLSPFVKDAFHEYVVHGRADAVNPAREGTKAAAHYSLEVPAGGEVSIRLRLFNEEDAPAEIFGEEFDQTFARRVEEAEEFYSSVIPQNLSAEERRVVRQAYAGLLWSKQLYNYDVRAWLEGDPAQPQPPQKRWDGRNCEWTTLYNRDVVSMPDKWEYPWYAAWDLSFHMIPFAHLDPDFAKEQLVLFLREWYMHPNGQLPAYEFAFSDANPPVHAWACWEVCKMTQGADGKKDRFFLERVFQKLLINFTWWVNRKDVAGRNLFAGGFLGLDNIGVFDRSKPLPAGETLEQADGTAWMAFYCATMLRIALELADEEPEYEDIASKFFEHFVQIVDAINAIGNRGLWDERDGFYYDEVKIDGGDEVPLRIRSLVGAIPLIAVVNLDEDVLARLKGFSKRMNWLLENRRDLARHISYAEKSEAGQTHSLRLLAIPSRERLESVLRYLLDEREFLSPFGLRSLSRAYADAPYSINLGGREYRIDYEPGESTTGLFGGNSNWRGPVWFPVNFLIVQALERYHHFYGETFRVECPTGSGNMMTLAEVSKELARRLASIFLPDEAGRAPWQGDDARFAADPHWRGLTLFHEYFHGETGRGVGASHQTGWTALVAHLFRRLAQDNWGERA
ncbi:MAG: glucosidase, partial [Acidobacteriota bacterium]|nr:glucosidase [Acidobacteriota bacterium]